jgi:hypothetical protein
VEPGLFTESYVADIIKKIMKGSITMATKREYLKTKGITVGARGRFSAAAKQALSEAESSGVKFEAETKAKKA